jgi:hypothetical protein
VYIYAIPIYNIHVSKFTFKETIMPYDKNNAPLKVGDRCSLELIVTSIQEGEEYCNLELQTVEGMHPSGGKSMLVLNSKQVVKLASTQRILYTKNPIALGVGDAGYTVRKGNKWLSASGRVEIRQVLPGNQGVRVPVEDHPCLGRGQIIKTFMLPFSKLSPQVVEENHVASARTRQGLLEAMQEAYPDFREDDLCTVIYYQRLD